MLRDLHLLDGLPEGGPVAGAVLAHHADLLRALRLKQEKKTTLATLSTQVQKNHELSQRELDQTNIIPTYF